MVFSEKIGEGFVEITTNMRGFNRSVQGAVARMRAAGQTMQSIGTRMSAALTLPMAAVGTAAGKMAADFEQSMQKIVSLVGIGQTAVNEMKRDVQDLAEETARAPEELADAMFFITSAGLRGSEATQALEASAKAAAAGMGETKTVADAATSAMNAYGESNLNAEKAVSVLVKTVREGKVETNELAGVVGRVIPLASELGVSFEEVGGSLAAMTRLGLGARESATALRGIFRALIKPSEQAKDTLDQFGLSAETLRERVAGGDIIGVLQDLKETFGDNEEALSNVFPRVRGLLGVLSLVGENASDARNIMAELSGTTGGALNQAFQSASETASFKFMKALSQLKSSLIDFGRAILPIVIPLIQKLSDFIRRMADRFRNASEETQRTLVKWAAGIAAIGPALVALGTVLSTFAGILSTVLSAFTSLSSLFSIQGGIMIGIATALGAAIDSIWNDNLSVFENLKNIWGTITDSVVSMWERIKPLFSLLKDIWDNLGKSIVSVSGDMTTNFENIKQIAKDVANGMLMLAGAILKVVNAIAKIPSEFPGISKLVGLIADLVDILSGATADVLETIGTILGGSAGMMAGGVSALAQGGPGALERFRKKTVEDVQSSQPMNIVWEIGEDVIGEKSMEWISGGSATINARR